MADGSTLWGLIGCGSKRFFCSTCGCDFYERNKEKKHWVYTWNKKGDRGIRACGNLLTYNQKKKQLKDWDIKHPKNCRYCGGNGYIIIGGTESEICHCRPKEHAFNDAELRELQKTK